jgi:high frequency lysogenization protein
MIKTLANQAIALAGLAQATHLVKQIAQRGAADAGDMEAVVRSVFALDAEDVPSVYGGIGKIKTGLKLLDRQLAGFEPTDAELARYGATLILLERNLVGDPRMLETLRAGIAQVKEQAEYFGELNDTVYANLADLYQRTLSRLRPRVMVNGQPSYLTNSANANRIRALLLAGVRAVVLWRQCGGERWKLLFQRSALRKEAQRLLQAA